MIERDISYSNNLIIMRRRGTMVFGYTPSSHPLKDLIKRLIGWPIISRRVEASLVLKPLNPKPRERIIDLGCGIGVFCIELAKRGLEVVGIDVAIGGLVLANHVARKMRLKNVVFVAADAQKLPFKDGSFSKALCNCTLEHIKDDRAAITETWRILKDEGILVLTVPNARKNIGQSILPLTKFVISWPQWLKKLLANKRRSIQESRSIEEMQKRLFLREWRCFHAGYDTSDLKGLLENLGFKIVNLRYYLQTFGAIAQDIRYTFWICEHRIGRYITFPFLHSMTFFDKLVGESIEGYGIALKAIKYKYGASVCLIGIL